MQFVNRYLCDFCFEDIMPGQVCPRCGLTHATYQSADLLPVGTNLLGKYIIGRVLGRGGFGATYLAFSSAMQKRVAVKEFYPNGIACRGKGEANVSLVSEQKKGIFQKGSKRFYREAETISKFNANPNVVSVYEFFYANGTVYYAMEYLDGIDLKGYVARRSGSGTTPARKGISEEEAVTIMRHVCRALKDVHSTGTLHLDISPDNVFLCTDQSVKLVDFGAAKQLVGEESQSLEVVLKQGFAPPEQYSSNSKKQGWWTDIYSLGGTVFYALTGSVPTEAMSRVNGDDDTMFQKLQGVSPQLRSIIEKCMKIDVKARFQTAVELEGALNALPFQDVPINTAGDVQSIYVVGGGSGVWNTGESKTFVTPTPGFTPPGYPGSRYPQSGVPNYPMSAYPVSQQKSDSTSSLLKGILIGVASLVIIVLLVFLLRGPMMGPPGGPFGPGGSMPPPPMGQMPPPPPPGGWPPNAQQPNAQQPGGSGEEGGD